MTIKELSSEYLEECRQTLASEQAKSLAETNNWSHVDKAQVHLDWETLYNKIASHIDTCTPTSQEAQDLIAQHFSIASRFYRPNKKAYIGLALFYDENQDMNTYHNAYHPKMTHFLGDAILCYANLHL